MALVHSNANTDSNEHHIIECANKKNTFSLHDRKINPILKCMNVIALHTGAESADINEEYSAWNPFLI